MTLSPLYLVMVPSRARESFPELPAFTPNFVPFKIIKRRNRSKQPLSAHWKPRGPGAICVLVCVGGLRMLMTGQVPSGSPPPVGDRTDPLQLSAAEKALAVSQPESHLPEESQSPSCCGDQAPPLRTEPSILLRPGHWYFSYRRLSAVRDVFYVGDRASQSVMSMLCALQV